MPVKLSLNQNMIWDYDTVDFYAAHRDSYVFPEETEKHIRNQLNLGAQVKRIQNSGDRQYYSIFYDDSVVGELIVTQRENEEEIMVAIFEKSKRLASAAIRSYLKEYAKKRYIVAILMPESPSFSYMEKLLKGIGFEPQKHFDISAKREYVNDHIYVYENIK